MVDLKQTSLHVPKLHVVTLARNAESGLIRTAWSLANQVHAEYHHHIVTADSRDRTESIAVALAQSRNVSHHDMAPKGIYPAMQWILEALPVDDYVWFLNAGDFLLSPTIARDLISAMSIRGAAWVTSGFITFLPTGRILNVVQQSEPWYPRDVGHQATVAQVSLLRRSGGFDPSFEILADAVLMRRVMSVAEPQVVPQVAIAYELGGLSSKRPNAVARDIRRIERLLPLSDARRRDFSFVKHYLGMIRLAGYLRARAVLPGALDRIDGALMSLRRTAANDAYEIADHWKQHEFDATSVACCLAAATAWARHDTHAEHQGVTSKDGPP